MNWFDNVDKWPPGSKKAKRRGCTCESAKDAGFDSEIGFFQGINCPLHSDEVLRDTFGDQTYGTRLGTGDGGFGGSGY